MKNLFRLSYLFFIVFLAGCYFPNNFSLDLRITDQGRFALQYQGEILVDGLMSGQEKSSANLKPEDYIYDLHRRFPGFQKISYKGNGVFDVFFVDRDDLYKIKTYTFLDRGNRFITMNFINPREIVIFGNMIPKNFRDKLKDMHGIARVWTNAKIIYTNANRVINSQITRYEWDISANMPVPKMIIAATN